LRLLLKKKNRIIKAFGIGKISQKIVVDYGMKIVTSKSNTLKDLFSFSPLHFEIFSIFRR
jgi:hypothetical protein